ncbi:hypothetical protein BP6252_11148 [Coleophoma cylindrospora]|uniref:Heterokaryon incompatibility domain-containing protein n=1 Tax=Coleophoma cylindrospora TaxID=1849047 RepID=A0A3D8QP53_9HELO|nr:hypothetical protein BP6252_11148 [Coleophoma cylindrospora]
MADLVVGEPDTGESSLPRQSPSMLLPASVESLLDDEESPEKILPLFLIVSRLASEHQVSGSVEILDRAIVFAERLVRLLETQQTPVPCIIPPATAAELLMMLFEQKMDATSDTDFFTKLIAAAKYHLELTAPDTPANTLGTLGYAYVQHYRLSNDHDILMEAIEYLQQYLDMTDETYLATLSEDETTEEYSSDEAQIPGREVADETDDGQGHKSRLYLGARLNLVKCLEELYQTEKSVDNLNKLIFGSAYSLMIVSSATSEYSEIQQILNYALMVAYFRQIEPEVDVAHALSSISEPSDSTLINSAAPVRPTTENDISAQLGSLSVSGNIYDAHKLYQGTSQVRVLDLHPGKEGDPIMCTLRVVDLDADAVYDALSYVWGDPKITKGIFVNGAALEITTNLHAALSRLRSPETQRTLWIDAICINQTDNTEKMHQIGLMRKIYASAEEVAMWLGEPQTTPVGPSNNIKCSPELITGMREAWPEWLYSTLRPYLENPENLSSANENQPNITYPAGEDLRFRRLLEQLPREVRPIFYGAGTPDMDVTRDPEGGSLTTLITMLFAESCNAIQDFASLLNQNTFARKKSGPRVNSFDWRDPSAIPYNFLGRLEPLEWHVLGAFTIIYSLSENKHLTDLPFFVQDEDINRSPSQGWLKSLAALKDLLAAPYWTRAWIVQEIVLARNPTIYYGPHILDYRMLARAQMYFEHHLNQPCCGAALEMHQRQPCDDITIWGDLNRSFQCIKESSELWVMNDAERAKGSEIHCSWGHILASGLGSRQATDARDLVYGVLGLVLNEGPDKLMADYNVSVATVFAEATKRIIDEKTGLQVLAFTNTLRNEKYNLPSWVPDWTAGAESVGIPYCWDLSKASLDRAHDIHVSDDLCLSVTSTLVDVVGSIGNEIEDCHPHTHDDRASIVISWRRLAGLQDDLEEDSPLEDQFWRTLFADRVFDPDRPRKFKSMETSDIDAAKQWWRWFRGRESIPQTGILFGLDADPASWLQERNGTVDRMVHLFTNSRRFFVTSSGKLATGWGNTSEGDEIHVVDGCSVPLILRRVANACEQDNKAGETLSSTTGQVVAADCQDDNDDIPQRKCIHVGGAVYRLVGDSYVHGIMQGEALKESSVKPGKIFIQ